MPWDMKDGLQYAFVRNAFLSDDVYQLSAQSFMPVTIFECSHIYVREMRFRKISAFPAKR